MTEQAINKFGVARLTTRRIAESAGITEGPIFRHFSSKEKLVLAALQRHGEVETILPDPDVAGTGTIRDNIVAITSASLAHFHRTIPSAVAAAADAELLHKHSRWLAGRSSSSERLRDSIIAYIIREQQLCRIRSSIDPELVAETILSVCIRQALEEVL